MSVNDRNEEEIDVITIPGNVGYDFNIGRFSFTNRRMFEALIMAVPLAIIIYLVNGYLPFSFGWKLTIFLGVVGGALFLGLKGINGDNVSTYIHNMIKFYQKRRIAHKNPRPHTENRFFTEETNDQDYVIPRERVEALYRKYVNSSGSIKAENNLKEEAFDDSTMIFESDIEVYGKPIEMMTKREIRALERKKRKEERLRKRERQRELRNEKKKGKKKIAGI